MSTVFDYRASGIANLNTGNLESVLEYVAQKVTEADLRIENYCHVDIGQFVAEAIGKEYVTHNSGKTLE